MKFLTILPLMLLSPAASALEARVQQSPAGPQLLVNGQATAPATFFVNMDAGSALLERHLRQIELAGRQGVHIVSVPVAVPWFPPDKQPDFSRMDERMEQILKANPQAMVLPRIYLSAPNPAYEPMRFSDGTDGHMPSIHGSAWRRDARAYLQAIVRHMESKYHDSVIGYHPCGQETAEWFYGQFWQGKTPGYEPSALSAFREWLKKNHASDAALQAAWGDDAVTLETATAPTPEQCAATTTGGMFRDPKAERKVIDFFAFQNEAMADVAALMCQATKEIAPDKLSLTFYGYTFELSAAPHGIQSSGHLALRRLLASPHVDALAGPVSYMDRAAGGGGYYMGPADSAALHGKLWLVEDDTRTHFAKPPPPEIDPTGEWARFILKDPRETRGVLSRNFAHFFTRGQAAWWMDLLGEGWYDDPEIWQQLGKLHAWYQASIDKREAWRPEIAVIVDEQSNLHLDPGPGAVEPLLGLFRKQWYRIGAPAGIYLLDDLLEEKVPAAKFYIILNAFHLTDARLATLRERIPAGATTLWMVAPGISDGAAIASGRVGQVTGMELAVAAAGGAEIKLHGGGTFDSAAAPHRPLLAVTDPGAATLATFADGGEVAVAAKSLPAGKSVFSAVPQLPASLLRVMAREAGVHIYADTDDIIAAGNGIVAIHASSDGSKSLRLPASAALRDIVTGESFTAAASFAFKMKKGDTRLLEIRKP